MEKQEINSKENYEKIAKVAKSVLDGINSSDDRNAISWTNSSKIGEISDEQVKAVISELGLEEIEQRSFIEAVVRHSLAGAEVTSVRGCGELGEVLKKLHSAAQSKM